MGAADGSGDKEGRLWYGSEVVLDRWFGHLVEGVDFSAGGQGVKEVQELVDTSVAAPGEKPSQ